MKLIKEHGLFLIIFASAAILRLIPLFDYQYTLDELSGLNRTQFASFSELIDKGVKIDAHPALIQVLIYWLSSFFGYAASIIKLPFLLFSLAAIVYAYYFAYRNFSKRVAIFSTLVFSYSLVFVFYAPIARMYISGVFFSVGLLTHFYEIFFLKNTKWLHYILLGLFAWLSALNQHINALFALSLCFSGLFFLNKENAKKYLITCVLVVFAYLPHLGVTLYQFNIGGIGLEEGGWLEKPVFFTFLKFLKILFGVGATYSVFVVLVILKNVYELPTKINFRQIFLFLIFMFNYWVVYTYSVRASSIYQHSVMLFSGVCMVFLVCSLFDFTKAYFYYPAVILLSFVLIKQSYVDKDFYDQTVKTVFEYQFERTTFYKKQLGDKNVYPIFFDADDFMKMIYFEKYKVRFDCKISADPVTQKVAEFNQFISGLNSNYLILTSSSPLFDAVARRYYPYLIENTESQANHFKLYSRLATDSNKVVADDKVLSISTPQNNNNWKYNDDQLKKFLEGGGQLKVDPMMEFPFDSRKRYKEFSKKEGEIILLSAQVKLNDPSKRNVDACISITDHVSSEVYQYAAQSGGDFGLNADSTETIYAQYFVGSKHNFLKGKTASTICYLWNKGKCNFVLQNFEIQRIDYWPKKWSFWN